MTKASKAAVHYTPHAENHKHRCGLCMHFKAPRECAIVLGEISRQGWCEEFHVKEKERA